MRTIIDTLCIYTPIDWLVSSFWRENDSTAHNVNINVFVLLEYLVDLLCHSNESGSSAQLLQLLSPHICTCGPQSPQDVLHSMIDITTILQLDCFAL